MGKRWWISRLADGDEMRAETFGGFDFGFGLCFAVQSDLVSATAG